MITSDDKIVSMSKAVDLLKYFYERISKYDDDRVILVSGQEGAGKSTFTKHLFDIWFTKILKKKQSDDLLRFFTFGKEDWSLALREISYNKLKYYMLASDEGVNLLYFRDSTSKSSKVIKKSFNQIRALNICHLLLIPRFWEIDEEILKSRVKGLWYIHRWKGNRVASFYSVRSLHQLISEIQYSVKNKTSSKQKSFSVLDMNAEPLMRVRFGDYKGWVNNKYMKNKDEIIKKSVDDLIAILNPNAIKKEKSQEAYDKSYQIGAKIHKLKAKGLSYQRMIDEKYITGYSSWQTLSKKHKLYENSEETVKD